MDSPNLKNFRKESNISNLTLSEAPEHSMGKEFQELI